MRLVETIHKGMQKVNARRTEESLGDRSEYIGASDIGQCPRKAVFEKILGESPDMTTLVRYERGHLAELILGAALEAEGFIPQRQVELTGETINGTPLKFHLDFVFHSKAGDRFAILEGKSTTPIPHSPYEGWELQLHAQMGLAKALLGDRVQVEGAIFALDMAPKDGAEPYGAWNGYKADMALWDEIQKDADTIYQAVLEYKSSGNLPENLPCRVGPLCSFCSCLADCPIFKGEQADDLAPKVEVLKQLQQKRKRLAKFESDAKDELKAILRNRGWVSVAVDNGNGNGATVKLKVNNKSSRRTNFKELQAALESRGDSLNNYSSQSSYEELMVKG